MAWRASRGTGPSSRAWRRPSAEAVPWIRSWMGASPAGNGAGRVPPSMRRSPPRARACTPARLKPRSVKATVPRARARAGAPGMAKSLPGRMTLPCTLLRSRPARGSDNCSFTSAGPLTVAWASGWPSVRATGEALKTASDSANGPRTVPVTPTTPSAKLGMAASACTCSPGTPANRPWALFTCMPARSNTSSPDRPVSAGQTGPPGGRALLRGA